MILIDVEIAMESTPLYDDRLPALTLAELVELTRLLERFEAPDPTSQNAVARVLVAVRAQTEA